MDQQIEAFLNPGSRSNFHCKVGRHFSAGSSFCLGMLFTLSASVAGAGAKPVFPLARHAEAPAKRRNVIDYFNLLPSYGNSTAPKERRELLQFGTNPDTNPTIDLHHDYLLVHPDSAPAEQIAVFRARGKSDVVAVTDPDSESDYNCFALFRLRNGRLRDVTRQMLPMSPQTDRFLYELPQFGTTIRVYRFKLGDGPGRHAFDLQWRGGRFVKVW